MACEGITERKATSMWQLELFSDVASFRPLTLFPNLSETLEEVRDTDSSEPPQSTQIPATNPVMSLEQLLATKSDSDSNS
ncbi:hypothetical protein ACSBR2_004665 [Camellia fascicularis]